MAKCMSSSSVKTVAALASKCSDKAFVDSLIQRYESEARSAVEKTVAMCRTVAELHQGEKSGRLTKHDVSYFCDSVKLRKNSSQYRKYICIGQAADLFQEYMDRLPQAVSVLYEITTIDSDKFVELVDKNLIDASTSLRTLKVLAGKPIQSHAPITSSDSFKIEFDIASISKESARLLVDFYTKLKSNTEITITSNKFDTLQKFLDEGSSACALKSEFSEEVI